MGVSLCAHACVRAPVLADVCLVRGRLSTEINKRCHRTTPGVPGVQEHWVAACPRPEHRDQALAACPADGGGLLRAAASADV